MTNAPAPPPALVASAEGEPVTDLDHARYDRDGWMESALRAQGYVGELQGRLAAAESARDEALRERDGMRANCAILDAENQQLSDKADAALARAERAERVLLQVKRRLDEECAINPQSQTHYDVTDALAYPDPIEES